MKRIKVDQEKCTGCRTCELTCSVIKYGYFNIHSAHCRLPETELLPNAPIFCRQCKNAICIEKCPQGAIKRNNEAGIVEILTEKCNRCGICIEGCPFNAVFINEVSGYPVKCDLCGGEPRCVDQCPEEALILI